MDDSDGSDDRGQMSDRQNIALRKGSERGQDMGW